LVIRAHAIKYSTKVHGAYQNVQGKASVRKDKKNGLLP